MRTKKAKIHPIYEKCLAELNDEKTFIYVDTTDVAKLIRADLKKSFPGIKFSVRSDNNSVRISYFDGPLYDEVDKVGQKYKGGGFDGMIDMAYSSTSWLNPDGTAGVAHNPGTIESRGSCPEYINNPTSAGAIEVQFGSKYIFIERRFSEKFYNDAIDKMWSECDWTEGHEKPEVAVYDYDKSAYCNVKSDKFVSTRQEYLSTLIGREIRTMKGGSAC